MSGLTVMSNRAGPRELYSATVSSDRPTVPHVFSAPTVMANGELPGDVMPPSTVRPSADRPSLPADGHDDDAGCGRAGDGLAERIGRGRLA